MDEQLLNRKSLDSIRMRRSNIRQLMLPRVIVLSPKASNAVPPKKSRPTSTISKGSLESEIDLISLRKKYNNDLKTMIKNEIEKYNEQNMKILKLF